MWNSNSANQQKYALFRFNWLNYLSFLFARNFSVNFFCYLNLIFPMNVDIFLPYLWNTSFLNSSFLYKLNIFHCRRTVLFIPLIELQNNLFPIYLPFFCLKILIITCIDLISLLCISILRCAASSPAAWLKFTVSCESR